VLTLAESRTHVLIRGNYEGGFLRMLQRLFREVKGFLVVFPKSSQGEVHIRVNP
jgi:hypothetical protein